MKLIFSEAAWEDYLYWQQTDKRLLKRTNELIQVIQRDPFVSIGKPEPLKHGFSGYWSRRINDEHRIVYKANTESPFRTGNLGVLKGLDLHSPQFIRGQFGGVVW